MRLLIAAVTGSLFCTALAADPLAGGDAAAGKALHDAKCMGCHGTEVYARADRKIQNARSLVQRVAMCDANFVDGLTPQDEIDVATYLNQAFYRFK